MVVFAWPEPVPRPSDASEVMLLVCVRTFPLTHACEGLGARDMAGL